jgi:hypothetical protein
LKIRINNLNISLNGISHSEAILISERLKTDLINEFNNKKNIKKKFLSSYVDSINNNELVIHRNSTASEISRLITKKVISTIFERI